MLSGDGKGLRSREKGLLPGNQENLLEAEGFIA